jgi:hypothetical protein
MSKVSVITIPEGYRQSNSENHPSFHHSEANETKQLNEFPT